MVIQYLLLAVKIADIWPLFVRCTLRRRLESCHDFLWYGTFKLPPKDDADWLCLFRWVTKEGKGTKSLLKIMEGEAYLSCTLVNYY